ncbi:MULTISPECIES: SPOR domain-containing protein [Francisella]|uniref:SPOR domain-containing protein n=1 Tax=Francisella TaxID=262 RepID=UPI0011B69752|nr:MULTISPECIES: SPOR domain-containing protein [Francisella]
MKDLSRLDIPKKPTKENNKEPQKPSSSKRKKIVIIAVVCLLVIAVASKLINKHLKKVKAEEEKAKVELQVDQNSDSIKEQDSTEDNTKTNSTNSDQKPDFTESGSGGKMVFTFYNSLKHDSVEVDVQPDAQRAQYKYKYIYQIASFRNMDETSWYVKKMKEDGLNPQFQRVGSWIRMYIGPYDSKRAMAPDIIKLQRIGLNGGFPREISRTKIEPKDAQKDSKNKSSDNSEESSSNKTSKD